MPFSITTSVRGSCEIAESLPLDLLFVGEYGPDGEVGEPSSLKGVVKPYAPLNAAFV